MQSWIQQLVPVLDVVPTKIHLTIRIHAFQENAQLAEYARQAYEGRRDRCVTLVSAQPEFRRTATPYHLKEMQM